MSETPNLKLAIGLPPEKAVEYFRSKGYAITWNWHDQWQEAHARAFTVAKAMRVDILQDIRAEVQRALDGEITERDFIRNLEPRLKARGWWGKQVIVDSEGNAQVAQLGSPWRLKTIYRTNMQTAYMAGRYRQMMENTANRPYWQYVAVMDSHTRPSHAALNGKVFRHDDPFWNHFYPPNGFNCRCTVRALTDKNLADRGLDVSASGGDLGEKWAVDKRSGFTERVATYKGPGMRRAVATDLGFDYNAGKAASWTDTAFREKAAALFPERQLGLVLASVATAAPRMAAFGVWVDEVFAAGRSSGREWVLGWVAPADAAALAKRGESIGDGSVVLADRLLVGAKAERHVTAGDALTAEEWKVLPLHLADPEAVLFDTHNRTLLYVFAANDGRRGKIVVAAGRAGKKRDPHESVRTVFKVPALDLEAGLKGGVYEKIR
ncbi:MAG: phage minor head protein [Pseudomonadota bacterium]